MTLRGETFALGAAMWLCGCTSGIQITVETPVPRGTDPPIFVTAARQKDAIVRALRMAGFRLVDALGPGVYLMRVTLGVDQATSSCGSLNNVRFALRQNQSTLIEAEAKGWTGSCQPNVLDEVSRALRARMLEMIQGAPDAHTPS